MNCDQVQPNLLEYGRNLLSRSEHERIKAHLQKCPECAAAFREEMELYRRLSSMPEESPRNDVWTLIRSRTGRKRIRLMNLIDGAISTTFRRIASTAALAALVVFGIYGLAAINLPQPPPEPAKVVVAVYSDDPIAGHTDAVIDSIDNM